MSTGTVSREPDNWLPALALMSVFIVVVGLVVGQVFVKPMFINGTASESNGRDHSVEKHGIEIVNAHNACTEQNGLTGIWKNTTRRTLCEVADLTPENVNWCDIAKKWSCKIIDSVSGEIITTFGHAGTYWSLIEYMNRSGYELLMGK